MRRYAVAVVGAGASGITAAISASRKGASVVICEKMPGPGRKILVSGNGRCNLLNERLDESHYNQTARKVVKTILGRFGKDALVGFFKELGLELHSEEGRIFPVTNQSASVLKVLEMELNRLSIPLELNFEVSKISCSKNGFNLVSKTGKSMPAKSVVLAGGGKTYPALGSDGSAYKLASDLGHRIITPVPSAVPLVVKDPICHLLQGQKISARTKSVINGKFIKEAFGDVLFTKYGLSGTAILDISEEVSIAINRDKRKDVSVLIDMTPFMSEKRLAECLAKRMAAGLGPGELIAGILPNKFGSALKNSLVKNGAPAIAVSLKDKTFNVAGTRGWNEADFTAGGIDLCAIDENSLGSKLKKGLYLAGEVLDVTGKRGGYNLAWAWASGFVAGEEAAAFCAA